MFFHTSEETQVQNSWEVLLRPLPLQQPLRALANQSLCQQKRRYHFSHAH